ncbi:MAG: leucine-rich repeat domain-containing protein, partial [Ruminococcaceae bacterium]|nr:leucine-rich repeat domain-containing protein [Oscillospiraceae bacterium]
MPFLHTLKVIHISLQWKSTNSSNLYVWMKGLKYRIHVSLCDNNRSLYFLVCAASVVHTFCFLRRRIMKKKLLLLFLVCLSAVAIFSITASAATYGDLSYEVSNGEVTITSCSATVISITIPSTIDGHPVTSIGRYAFDDCDILTSIIIPNSVTSIGRYAFNDCDSLEEITIPSSMTSIGEFAFSGCTGLTSITIPNSVTSIGSYAFHYCTFLTSITIPDSVTSIGSYALRECTSLTSITIPESVTSIGESAFLSCTSLEEITLPYVGKERDGTANTHFGYIFGASSYSDNYGSVSASLRKVTITSGTAIPENAFYGCSNLTSITIPDSVTSIGGSAF